MLLLLSACSRMTNDVNIIDASKERVIQTFQDIEFHSIEVNDFIEVIYRQADEPVLMVEMSENLIEFLDVAVQDGTLRLRFSTPAGMGIQLQELNQRAYIYAPSLNEVYLGGTAVATDWDLIDGSELILTTSGFAEGKFLLEVDNLILNAWDSSHVSLDGIARNATIDASGFSGIHLGINVELLEGILSDSSRLVLDGMSDTVVISGTGFSEFFASRFGIQTATIHLSDSSRAEAFVLDRLYATVDGFSEIIYGGEPTVIKELSGNGTIGRE